MRNEQLTADLGVMDAHLAQMAGRIAEAESSAKQRADSIERYTRQMDAVNRGVEKAISARGPEINNGGPWCSHLLPSTRGTKNSDHCGHHCYEKPKSESRQHNNVIIQEPHKLDLHSW